MSVELVRVYIVIGKEREEFRWRSGIGWKENRKSMGMNVLGSG